MRLWGLGCEWQPESLNRTNGARAVLKDIDAF